MRQKGGEEKRGDTGLWREVVRRRRHGRVEEGNKLGMPSLRDIVNGCEGPQLSPWTTGL